MRDPDLTLRLASRAMGRHGLVHAYGHVSERAGDSAFLVSPPQPLITVPTTAEGTIVSISGELPDGVLGEVRLHREIYRRRPDVGGICRIQPPAVMALSALGRTPRPLHGPGTYFAPAPPIWMGTALIRDDASASAVADLLGSANGIVLRGNGAAVVGDTLEIACAHAFFLEDAAKVELTLLSALTGDHSPIEYSPDEVAARATAAGGIYERMWRFLCFGDPEWQHANMK